MNGAVGELMGLIDRFLSGADTSLGAAHKMEAILLTNFVTEDWFDELSLALAQYSPGGGEHLLAEPDLAGVLREIKGNLDTETL